MSVAGFMLVALVAGNFTRGFFNSTRRGIMLDLCSGLIGAVVAGSLVNERGRCGGLRKTFGRERMLQRTAGVRATMTQESEMDWDFAQANWAQFRDEVHANWGMLTPRQLELIAGRRVCLANKIGEAYGVTGDEAERQIKSFEARNVHPRPVSFR